MMPGLFPHHCCELTQHHDGPLEISPPPSMPSLPTPSAPPWAPGPLYAASWPQSASPPRNLRGTSLSQIKALTIPSVDEATSVAHLCCFTYLSSPLAGAWLQLWLALQLCIIRPAFWPLVRPVCVQMLCI